MKERYYIQSKGELYRDRNTLRFRNETTDTRIPVERVYDIFAEEGVSLSSGVLELLAEKEILLHSFSHYGNYVGTFTPKESVMSGKCAVKQAEHYNEKQKRMEIASLFVEGSIENMRLTLMKYRDDCCSAFESLGNKQNDINRASDIPSLMRVEGDSREEYYSCLDHQINGFDFKTRTKQPPESEINALLSYLNCLLYPATITELYKTRLDQKVSFLHEPHERRFSLSLDISDIFKPIIVDRLVVSLVNQNIVSEEDFRREGAGVFLNEDGRKTVASKFKERLATTRKHPGTKKTHSMRRWIRMECHKITKHVLGKEEYSYVTFR